MNKLLILLRMIKKDVPFLILLPTLLVLAIEASASGRSLDLYAGQAKTLGLGTITRVAVGNPEIVNYKVLENGSLLLIGVQPGISTVSIWKDGDRHDTLEITV
ncbi:MAG: pilus assembly protein N-terminal domain-containing protein, partial [Methylococcales bacterium]|nr:pilus assembly protein N-terminal domain-containing protein [Methylococcales bacterium]